MNTTCNLIEYLTSHIEDLVLYIVKTIKIVYQYKLRNTYYMEDLPTTMKFRGIYECYEDWFYVV